MYDSGYLDRSIQRMQEIAYCMVEEAIADNDNEVTKLNRHFEKHYQSLDRTNDDALKLDRARTSCVMSSVMPDLRDKFLDDAIREIDDVR